ncbi:von Willebrand factor type A domain-containing protein [Myxococcaceae bacterium GXIMD 01537]
MHPSTLNRLSRWGSAALALSLLPACATKQSAPEPALQGEVAQQGVADSALAPAPSSGEAHDDGLVAAPRKAKMAPSKVDRSPPREAEAPAKPMPMSPAVAPSGGPMQPPPPLAEESRRVQRGVKADIAAVAPERREPPADKDLGSDPAEGGNRFETLAANPFTHTAEDALSTFAVDVDTASYSLARRYLTQGNLPPHAAVRVEEFVNYFKYRYTPPEKGAFTVHLEGAPSPFGQGHHFLRVGVQGKVVSRSERKPAHLVFLVDTSGSMHSQDKLPLAKEAMKIAVKNLNENDTVAIVTYAGSTRDVLAPTPATDVKTIHAAIEGLTSGGGTAMGSGMEMAYKHAVKKASGNVVSRVIVLTDGDANIGPNLGADAMLKSIGKYVSEGVTLSTIGFGMGNYRDDLMEKLADKGNGNCFYIDSYREAKKVFETQLTGTMEVIAKDVKLQVEFNPKAVRRYRLVGYENRDVADKDFRDDKVDAGEIGAGHSVTAVYEVELTDSKEQLATVRIRAKAPNGTEAAEQAFAFERPMLKSSMEAASPDFRFAVSVAASADILRNSPASRGWSLLTAQKIAEGATQGDADRNEFVKLIAQARALLGASAGR